MATAGELIRSARERAARGGYTSAVRAFSEELESRGYKVSGGGRTGRPVTVEEPEQVTVQAPPPVIETPAAPSGRALFERLQTPGAAYGFGQSVQPPTYRPINEDVMNRRLVGLGVASIEEVESINRLPEGSFLRQQREAELYKRAASRLTPEEKASIGYSETKSVFTGGFTPQEKRRVVTAAEVGYKRQEAVNAIDTTNVLSRRLSSAGLTPERAASARRIEQAILDEYGSLPPGATRTFKTPEEAASYNALVGLYNKEADPFIQNRTLITEAGIAEERARRLSQEANVAGVTAYGSLGRREAAEATALQTRISGREPLLSGGLLESYQEGKSVFRGTVDTGLFYGTAFLKEKDTLRAQQAADVQTMKNLAAPFGQLPEEKPGRISSFFSGISTRVERFEEGVSTGQVGIGLSDIATTVIPKKGSRAYTIFEAGALAPTSAPEAVMFGTAGLLGAKRDTSFQRGLLEGATSTLRYKTGSVVLSAGLGAGFGVAAAGTKYVILSKAPTAIGGVLKTERVAGIGLGALYAGGVGLSAALQPTKEAAGRVVGQEAVYGGAFVIGAGAGARAFPMAESFGTPRITKSVTKQTGMDEFTTVSRIETTATRGYRQTFLTRGLDKVFGVKGVGYQERGLLVENVASIIRPEAQTIAFAGTSQLSYVRPGASTPFFSGREEFGLQAQLFGIGKQGKFTTSRFSGQLFESGNIRQVTGRIGVSTASKTSYRFLEPERLRVSTTQLDVLRVQRGREATLYGTATRAKDVTVFNQFQGTRYTDSFLPQVLASKTVRTGGFRISTPRMFSSRRGQLAFGGMSDFAGRYGGEFGGVPETFTIPRTKPSVVPRPPFFTGVAAPSVSYSPGILVAPRGVYRTGVESLSLSEARTGALALPSFISVAESGARSFAPARSMTEARAISQAEAGAGTVPVAEFTGMSEAGSSSLTEVDSGVFTPSDTFTFSNVPFRPWVPPSARPTPFVFPSVGLPIFDGGGSGRPGRRSRRRLEFVPDFAALAFGQRRRGQRTAGVFGGEERRFIPVFGRRGRPVRRKQGKSRRRRGLIRLPAMPRFPSMRF